MNILVTGTPGVGKSALCRSIVQQHTTLNHVDVHKLVEEKELHDGYSEEWDSYILDEDKVIDELEDTMSHRNNILDYHSCAFFPERWFDLVVVLRCSNDILYPRLEERGYVEKKISENVTAEIMQVVLDEARESYKPEIVWELKSETNDDMEENTNKILAWIQTHGSSLDGSV